MRKIPTQQSNTGEKAENARDIDISIENRWKLTLRAKNSLGFLAIVYKVSDHDHI